MKLVLILAALSIALPAYADDVATTIMHDFATKWSNAYNKGDASGVAALYEPNATFSSMFGTLRGRAAIEKAIADQITKTPNAKITLTPAASYQNGNVVWGYGDFSFPNGLKGHYGLTIVNDGGVWHIAMDVSNSPKDN